MSMNSLSICCHAKGHAPNGVAQNGGKGLIKERVELDFQW